MRTTKEHCESCESDERDVIYFADAQHGGNRCALCYSDMKPKGYGWAVCIYRVELRCGGPEEGGWWYDAGEPADECAQYTRGFVTEDEANRYANSLAPVIATLNEGRRDISSVLSDGVYRVYATEGHPRPFPEVRPRYE